MMVCQVCPHEKRAEIDAAIIQGKPSRAIAVLYGVGSKTSVDRHRECIREDLRAASQKRGSRLLARVEKLCNQLESMADEAHSAKERGAFLMTARELRPTFLLAGQLSGEIASASVDAFLRALGVSGQGEIRDALDLRKSMSSATVSDFKQELLAGMRFLLAEDAEFRGEALAVLEGASRAELLPDESEVKGGGESPGTGSLRPPSGVGENGHG